MDKLLISGTDALLAAEVGVDVSEPPSFQITFVPYQARQISTVGRVEGAVISSATPQYLLI